MLWALSLNPHHYALFCDVAPVFAGAEPQNEIVAIFARGSSSVPAVERHKEKLHSSASGHRVSPKHSSWVERSA